MSRLKKFSKNLSAGYLQLGVNVIYSMVSIPLILHWLPKPEFGMWALLVQLMGYISMLDFGMTSAVARLLVDHKDNRSNGNYGSLIQTAALVSLIQALLILAATYFGSQLIVAVMKLPKEYHHQFTQLMQLQGIITAFSFSMRPLGMMLYAHQRMDLQAYNDIFNLMAQLVLLLIFLIKGFGIISFIYAGAITALFSPLYMFFNCYRLNIIPYLSEWGGLSINLFWEVFTYGKNIFIMGIGVQLIMASQIIVISRTMGLEVAATWSVGTKIFNLFVPLMCRPYGAAMPALYEMAARNEVKKIEERFRDLVLLTASLGVLLGVSLAMCNSTFITIWTSGKINWLPFNDILLGVWIFLSSIQTTHINFVNVTKQFDGARYIYFLEGICFISLALLLGGAGGTSTILVASIISQVLFSCQYGFRLSSRYFECHWSEFLFNWLTPCFKYAGILVPVCFCFYFVTRNTNDIMRLLLNALVVVILGVPLFIRLGLSQNIVLEIKKSLPISATKIFKKILTVLK